MIVEYRGRVLLDRGFGSADFELNVPNDGASIFRIGSLSKPFTAIAIMKLQEEHKLSIDDTVCKYLTDCPPAWAPVHLRHLLSHTSGIPDYFGEVSAGPTSRMREYIDQTVKTHLSSPLSSVAGESFIYSNFGYLLLGYVCEVAAKQPWEDVLRTRIFTPAGMTATAYDDVLALVPNRVRGYQRPGAVLQNIIYKDHGAFAAGGLRSTARDLLAWQHALSSGLLLTSSSLEEMLSPIHDNYALGWQAISLLGRRSVNHSGGIDGFASHFVHYRDDDLNIVVLSNISEEPAKTTACDLARIVFGAGQTVLDQSRTLNLPGPALRTYAGTYSGGEHSRSIEVRSNRLFYVRGTTPLELKPLTGDRFLMERATILAFDSTRTSLTMTDGCGTVVATMRRVAQ